MAFCTNCGEELLLDAKFCAKCGTPVNSNSRASDTSSLEQEKVIKEGVCNRVKSKLFVENGHGLLTDKRFIYNKHGFGKLLAIGVFVNLTKEDEYNFYFNDRQKWIIEFRNLLGEDCVNCTM